MPDPRVAHVHRKADAAIDAVRSRITCRGPGCSDCCRSDVLTHPAELAELLPHVPEAAWPRVEALGELTGLERLTAPCALLDPDTRRCTVYAHRPGVCRIYAVVGPPEDCDTGRGPAVVARPAAPVAALAHAMDHALPGGYGAAELMVDLLSRALRARSRR